MTSCTGSCDQGRKACPCPTACELPESDCDEKAVAMAVVVGLGLLLVIGLVIAFSGSYVMNARIQIVHSGTRETVVAPWGFDLTVTYEYEEGEPAIWVPD